MILAIKFYFLKNYNYFLNIFYNTLEYFEELEVL